MESRILIVFLVLRFVQYLFEAGLGRLNRQYYLSEDKRNEAVKALLSMAIQACKKRGKYIGICGQGPSDHPDLALWLLEQGIESMSLNPDTVVDTWLMLAKQEPACPQNHP